MVLGFLLKFSVWFCIVCIKFILRIISERNFREVGVKIFGFMLGF